MRNNQKRLGAQQQAAAAQVPPAGLMFEVPTEFVELPSRGKFYPTGHALHSQKTIEIKLMTAKEEDILASSALIKEGLAINRLMESIVVPDVDLDTLLVGDKNAIMVAARISAYGSAYNASVTCNECFREQEYVFGLEEMKPNETCFDEKKLKELGVSWDGDNCCYEYTLPKSEITVGIKAATGVSENATLQLEDSNLVTTSLKALVCSVEGNFDPLYVQSFVDNMLAWDSRDLRGLIPEIVPNIDMKQDFVCNNCGHQEQREVPLTAEFFWPR
jgi:hypothetical protein